MVSLPQQVAPTGESAALPMFAIREKISRETNGALLFEPSFPHPPKITRRKRRWAMAK
jgi:hypothetical protein